MSDRYSSYSGLKFDWPAERVLRVTMENAGKLNATDAVMHGELASIWRDVDADPDVSVAILRGAGKAFSAGGAFELVDELMSDHEARMRVWREARDIVYNVINCSKPVVAAIHGPAVGAGLAAAMVADVIIATKTARIIDGHTRLGVAAGDHSAIIWPLLIGMAKAKYYLLTCEPLSGEEAERLGLVSLCVEDNELEKKSVEVATQLANGAQAAIRLTKYALNNWLRMAGPSFDASLALEWMAWTGPEAQEGLTSLKEKRAPKFPKDTSV
ncbi:MAG: enoyl-CoA hydratase/isomerase family protein [Gammaproteobacteria bacterium]|nr:enoyl-CoA hydratase/isomerase family protein [Gammaproteobacteria bacterium]